MAFTRQNVYELSKPWDDPILWYARGVKEMQDRALADPTSWRFYAAIHGIDPQLWAALGWLSNSDQPPTQAVMKEFWRQCQHGSWYFLPWHRGFVLALEANIRAIVTDLGGPVDWALPYWNYFRAGQSALPPEFGSPGWPVDPGPNPLFREQRYGPNNDGDVFVPLNKVNLDAMNEPLFTGQAGGGSPGFGGVDTGFSHGGRVHGRIENQPHDWVHGLVGGSDPNDPTLPGLMSDPDTAGLDPIFWLHHANIDRLWASWNSGPPPTNPHDDPTDPSWKDGPAGTGERAFVMPMPDGTSWTYTPGEMMDTVALGYVYDDLSPAGVEVPVPVPAVPGGVGLAPAAGGGAVAGGENVELVGANEETVVVKSQTASRVRLDSGMRGKVSAGLAPTADAAGEIAPGDRVFLNLENVKGKSDASAFNVYVGVTDDEDPEAHPERLAGSVAPFGMRKASLADDEHAGDGLTFVLDITDIVNELNDEGSFDVDDLPVRIVPIHDLADEAEVSIGRISLFRQGQ